MEWKVYTEAHRFCVGPTPEAALEAFRVAASVVEPPTVADLSAALADVPTASAAPSHDDSNEIHF